MNFYIEQGRGEPLILLHGNGEDSSYFQHQISFFSKYFRVIAIDTRGHGKTPRGTAPFTIRQFVEDLRFFMDNLGIECTHLLGFSDGGNIAMIFAMTYPHRVKKLILNGANLHASGVKRSVQIPIEIGYRITNFFATKNKIAKQKNELLGLMVNDPNINIKDLKQIRAKTLVIVGNKDMILAKHTKLIADNIPHAELAIIQGNHFVANKNPKEFNRRVCNFLIT